MRPKQDEGCVGVKGAADKAQSGQRNDQKKIFVLDTNILIHDPDSIYKFEDNNIVIPFTVIEELDRLKRGPGEVAASARKVLRTIDELRKSGLIVEGVPMEGGGIISVVTRLSATGLGLLENGVEDNKIIRAALYVSENLPMENGDCPPKVILVSKDTAVRIKGESMGLLVEDYKHDKTSIFENYGTLIEADYVNGISSVRYVKSDEVIYRLRGESERMEINGSKGIEGILPKNDGQRCVIDALLDPAIEIIALTGSAGTGKTLLALAAGIHQVIQRTTTKPALYEKVVVARPIIPMGNDLGYLPGDIREKLDPWMQPIFDNLEVFVKTPKDQHKGDGTIGRCYTTAEYLIDIGVLQIEALTYIRGRSMPKLYFIVDEAQNLRPIDFKTIVTRAGEGTKIIFTGDMRQIDTPYLDATSNGLAILISRFINEENFCYFNLTSTVRSKLAEQGAKLL